MNAAPAGSRQQALQARVPRFLRALGVAARTASNLRPGPRAHALRDARRPLIVPNGLEPTSAPFLQMAGEASRRPFEGTAARSVDADASKGPLNSSGGFAAALGREPFAGARRIGSCSARDRCNNRFNHAVRRLVRREGRATLPASPSYRPVAHLVDRIGISVTTVRSSSPFRARYLS